MNFILFLEIKNKKIEKRNEEEERGGGRGEKGFFFGTGIKQTHTDFGYS